MFRRETRWKSCRLISLIHCYLKYNNSIKWMMYGSKNHLKYLSKTVQKIFMYCLSERNFTCPVLPIIVSKLLSLSKNYLSSMLNTMSILENYLHPKFCNIPSIISRRIWPSWNPNLSDIIVWFCSTLADSYGTYLSWHEPIKATFLNAFKLPLLLNLYKKEFLFSSLSLMHNSSILSDFCHVFMNQSPAWICVDWLYR